MQRAIATALIRDRGASAAQLTQAVIVPTAGAREALAQTLEHLSVDSGHAEILTRDEIYARLHARLAGAPPLLTPFEREVLLGRAAEAAVSAGAPPPFKLRPGLMAEILAFYDELMRRDRSVADFDRLMTASLEPSVDVDRGAERMFRQTRFLAATFDELERLVQESGAFDEHALRRHLLHHDVPGYEGIVVTVADQAADARGLWTADFDLLARMPGLQRLDVIATEAILAAGFHQRVHDLLPGIEEERVGAPAAPPVLVAPEPKDPTSPERWFVCRDREEELVDVARSTGAGDADRSAVVFQRPLPYLYLARYVFGAADRPYQAVDALPLAAEPFAAALDLVFAFLVTEANRASAIDLLGSPHWQFAELTGPPAVIRASVHELDTKLRETKYLGGWDRLSALADDDELRPVAAAAEALRPVREASTASAQIRALVGFIRAHERPPEPDAPWAERHARARTAVIDALESLASACASHDDEPLAIERLVNAVRRWIDGQTFSPRTGSRGVSLFDASAAPYADVDNLRIVGLVEHDWPERARRSIFYPSSLLSQLGWAPESERLAASRARFQDLLRLPRKRVAASTVTLEDDAIVPPSSFLEEIESSGLPIERVPRMRVRDGDAIFAHEALIDDEPAPALIAGDAAEWRALRASRSAADADAYRGFAGPREPIEYAVSHLERYLECPFKYFADRVLKLDEEREDESGLTPQERGQLLHKVFEKFFSAWHQRGGRAITPDCLDEALELFESVAEATLERVPDADRSLERTYLLGSAVASGLGERAFNFEIEHEVSVLERLLEHPLDGEFTFQAGEGSRRIRIRAKADRIDLLEDGTLRVIDYKLSRAPKPYRALQLPVYGVCAQQRLEGRHGKSWPVSRAGYVAFKEKNAFVALGGSTSLQESLEEGQRKLIAAVDGIERGEFPVRPEEPFMCTRCGYAGVCRKDYIGDE